MAGSAVSETILFVGAIIITTAVVGVLAGVVQNMSSGVRDRGGMLADELQTDITIINDPEAIDTSPLVIYAKNTGSRTLTASLTEVLLDGQVSESVSFDILGSSDDETWQPGDVLKMTVNDLAVGNGDHRVRVVSQNGIEDSLAFNV